MLKYFAFIPVWKRPEITELCFMGINRLGIEALAVISEHSMIPLCEKYSINWVMTENKPLGTKKNVGLSHAMNFKWDYLLEVGSDDLLKSNLFDLYKPYLGADVLGTNNFLYINIEDGSCRNYIGKTNYGLGRAISRHVVESMECLWHPASNKGLDNYSLFHMITKGFSHKRVKSEKPVGIDIKSEENIWPFNYFHGHEYDFDEALKGLSTHEIDCLNSIIHAVYK